jgi:hypothetical protein
VAGRYERFGCVSTQTSDHMDRDGLHPSAEEDVGEREVVYLADATTRVYRAGVGRDLG